MKKDRVWAARLAVIGAGCLWGSMGLFVRELSDLGLDSLQIAALRSGVTALVLAGSALLTDRAAFKVRPRDLWCFAGTGLASITFFNYCYFTAIQLMSMSAAAVLLYTSPVFVMLLSALLFGESITRRKLFSIGLCVGGCLLVSGLLSGSAGGVTLAGVLFGLGAGLGYALYSIFSRFAFNLGYGSSTVTLYTFIFAAVGGGLLADFPDMVGRLVARGAGSLTLVLFFALISTVLPYTLFTFGLRSIENSAASVLSSIEPVSATILGLIFFSEKPGLDVLSGMALILAALVVQSLGSGQKTASAL